MTAPAPPRRPPPRRLRRAGALTLAIGWLAAGLAGGVAYVHRYQVSRGFSLPPLGRGVVPATVRTVRFRSAALGRRTSYVAVLPPGYAAAVRAGRRFPVVYLLHGAPGSASGFVQTGAVAVRAAQLVAARRMPPALIVMPAGKEGIFHADSEWADTPSGRYESLVLDVVHDVDGRFATRADRRERVLGGLSEGGYGALNIGLHHVDVFSGLQSWSGYFAQTREGPFAHAPAAALAANSPSADVARAAPAIHRLGLRAYLYQGSGSAGPGGLRRFAARLHAAGADVGYGFFPGGHDWGLWRAQLPRMLTLAGRWFERSPRAPAGLAATGRPLPPAARRRALQAQRRRFAARRARRLARRRRAHAARR